MRTRRLTGFVALLTVVAAGCSWPQWGGGPEHRGTATAVNLTSTSVKQWQARRLVDLAATAPVVDANGKLFVVRNGRLSAVDPPTGGIVWAADLPAGATGTLAVDTSAAPGTVFVSISTVTGPRLLGFDPDGVRNCNPVLRTCTPIFNAALGSTASPATPVLVDNGRVYTHTATALQAFDAHGSTNCSVALGLSTCSPLWSATIGSAAWGMGPAATGSATVYDVGTSGATPKVFAIDQATGVIEWSGTLGAPAAATPSIDVDGTVLVPTGVEVDAFAGAGCGTASCSPAFRLTGPSGAAVDVRSTPAADGLHIFATTEGGELLRWRPGGCGASTCPATSHVAVDKPVGTSSDYAQSPIISGAMVFLEARRVVAGVNHLFLVALAESDRSEVKTWDLGIGTFGPGVANASLNAGLAFDVPLPDGVYSVAAPPLRPLVSLSTSGLTLSPAFDPSIFDYVLRCAAGTNTVGINATAIGGGSVRLLAPGTTAPAASLSTSIGLTPNQAAVLEGADAQGATVQYWIRCLPPDFPAITFTPHPGNGNTTPGWYLLANNIASSGTAIYAMVLDDHGTPVWYRRGAPTATNVTAVAPNTIAYMPTAAFAFGADPNGHYDIYSLGDNTVKSVAGVGVPTDVHEFQTLPNGDHLILSYPFKTGVDLTGLVGNPTAGPNSTIADCVVQDIAPNGSLTWEWRASDHIDPLTETTTAASATTVGTQTVYDVYHCNSIDPNPNGNLLVSARHANAVFEIRRSDGHILWKLGGTPVNKDGAAIIAVQNDPDGGPVQQHDARYLPNGHISMFDNQTSVPGRGVEYAVDLVNKTAQPVFSYENPQSQPSCCMGDFRIQPDGHRVIGWGFVIFGDGLAMTELDGAGHDVLDISLPQGSGEYRVTKVAPPFFDRILLRLTAGS